ncbi:hypothetical protein VPH35_091450 [Triticum aestivum]|uniref:C-repeat binding factor n=1 Tax=Triticum aestivum TaxID=4565 RepID=A0MPK1_WHEAT|nr:dehydration-responsive element-binding protein 1H-like [Triticum aestivum]ABK55366.1 CBFIIId-B12 [Triticum aestivum]CDI59410.1 C-repeat binding factor [Triticum aestivum]
MDTGPERNWNSPASPPSSLEQGMPTSPASPTPKRPAGRTKFKETRHPVFHGVRRRGSNGRWVCEVRVPGKRGERLWLGTHVTAEAAARAHDAAMLALYGRTPAARLNYPDSAWLLAVPSSLSDLADVRRAAIGAVVDFLRRQEAGASTGAVTEVASIDGIASAASAPDNASSAAAASHSQPPCANAEFEVPDALCHDMFELHTSGEMDAGTYYADLAQGLLLEPPPPPSSGASSEQGDDAALWNH